MSPPPHAQARDAAAIQSWLKSHLAGLHGIDPDRVDVSQPFSYYGLGSADAVMLAADLEIWLERPVDATLVWDHSSIAAAACALAVPSPHDS